MGYDNTGILFYGILLDGPVPWDQPGYEGEWEQVYLERVGFTGATGERIKERRAAVLSTAGCVAGIYNSCNDPFNYIALATAHHQGDSKPPLELDPAAMLLPPDADEIIRRFCGYVGVEYQPPRWYLTGLYG